MRIKNWDRFQRFTDRRPPWIKLHRDILDDADLQTMPADRFRFLVMLWLLASEDKALSGTLPTPSRIAWRLHTTEELVVSHLRSLVGEYIELTDDDHTMITRWDHDVIKYDHTMGSRCDHDVIQNDPQRQRQRQRRDERRGGIVRGEKQPAENLGGFQPKTGPDSEVQEAEVLAEGAGSHSGVEVQAPDFERNRAKSERSPSLASEDTTGAEIARYRPSGTILRRELVRRILDATHEAKWEDWWLCVVVRLDSVRDSEAMLDLEDAIKRVEDAADPRLRKTKDIGEFKQPGKWLVKQAMGICKRHKVTWPEFPK